MLSTNYFVHLFFDYDHDTHYTDTLLTLEPQAYLWYKLRLNHGFDAVLFFDRDYEELKVQTFDSFSKQLVEKKGFFDAVLKKTDDYQEIENCSQTLKKDFNIDDLLKIIERKELKGKKVAFAVSMSALNFLYEKSDEKAVAKLKRKIENPDGKSILVVEISPQPLKIRETFLDEGAVLPKLSCKISAALNGAQEPMMEALWRQMRGQIISGYRIDDALNMLLSIVAEKSDWSDSLENLKRQAAYLHTCFNTCGQLIFEPEKEYKSVMIVKHRELYEQLKNPDFRNLVRMETKKLADKYPELSVEEAMREEKLIPENSVNYLAVLEYDDPLVRNIRNLYIGEKLRGCYEYKKWQEQISRIKRNFSTFWNKPLNCLAYSKAEVFYKYAHSACINGDKNTFNDALEMLSFCGEQICAEDDKLENLAVILDYGKNIAELSENIFSILKKYRVDDIYEFSKIYVSMSTVPENSISVEKKIDLEIDKNNLDRYQQNRYTLKFYVSKLKSEIKLHKISDEEMQKVQNAIEKELNSEIEVRTETGTEKEEKQPVKEAETKKFSPCEEEDEEDFLYKFEEENEEDNKPSNNCFGEIKDENFADKLFGKTLYKDL